MPAWRFRLPEPEPAQVLEPVQVPDSGLVQVQVLDLGPAAWVSALAPVVWVLVLEALAKAKAPAREPEPVQAPNLLLAASHRHRRHHRRPLEEKHSTSARRVMLCDTARVLGAYFFVKKESCPRM
jgi:hypothetical protein